MNLYWIDTEIVPEKDCQDLQSTNKYMIMCYSYTANENNPGGFKELSAKKGTSIVLYIVQGSAQDYLEVVKMGSDKQHIIFSNQTTI